MPMKQIAIDDIIIDGNTQSRVSINQDVVTHYASLIKEEGPILPAIIVFFDGVKYWLADGFHRLHATNATGARMIVCDVRKGTQRDAILYSLNANVPHGLSLTNDDKHKAVLIMLGDPEWSEMTDRAIARHCGCSHPTVAKLRNPEPQQAPAKQVKESVPTGKFTTDADAGSDEATGKFTTEPEAPAPKEASKGLTQKQQEAAQNAEDAHGDSDPIAMLEEAQAQIDSLQKELFALQADDQKAETLKYKRIADIATRRQNELMDTVNSREKELQRLSNIIRRVGKAVGEEDQSKVASLVEALARKVK